MTMFVFWTMVTLLALLLGAGIAAMFCYSLFCYSLFFKFVGVAVLGGAFLTWILRS